MKKRLIIFGLVILMTTVAGAGYSRAEDGIFDVDIRLNKTEYPSVLIFDPDDSQRIIGFNLRNVIDLDEELSYIPLNLDLCKGRLHENAGLIYELLEAFKEYKKTNVISIEIVGQYRTYSGYLPWLGGIYVHHVPVTQRIK